MFFNLINFATNKPTQTYTSDNDSAKVYQRLDLTHLHDHWSPFIFHLYQHSRHRINKAICKPCNFNHPTGSYLLYAFHYFLQSQPERTAFMQMACLPVAFPNTNLFRTGRTPNLLWAFTRKSSHWRSHALSDLPNSNCGFCHYRQIRRQRRAPDHLYHLNQLGISPYHTTYTTTTAWPSS